MTDKYQTDICISVQKLSTETKKSLHFDYEVLWDYLYSMRCVSYMFQMWISHLGNDFNILSNDSQINFLSVL